MQLYYLASLVLGICVSLIFFGRGDEGGERNALEVLEKETETQAARDFLRPSPEMLEKAVERFDRGRVVENWELNQLERLAFTLDIDQIQGVIRRIESAKNPDRFAPVLTSLYARWAELDPRQAADAALESGVYVEAAMKGALLTWLEDSQDDALAWIVAEKPEHRQVLRDWIKHSQLRDYGEVAKAIEFIEQNWSEGADGLGRLLGERWVMTDDWRAAAAWASEDGDVKRSDEMLARIARLRGEYHGLDALEIVSLIESESTAANTRLNIFYWWGFESPGQGIQDLQGTGIPEEWSAREISSMSSGVVAKYPELLESFLDLAQTQAQRDEACLGALYNVDRWVVHDLNPAALQLSDQMANTERGRSALVNYYKGLHEQSAEKAAEFYQAVSSAKKQILGGVK